MKASHLLAPLFLSILQEQSAQTQYPRDVPADLQVTTKDNKIVMLNDVLAKGKTLLVFTTDGCPMMPQGGTKSPLADYANMDAAIKADKLEGTKIVFVIDYNAADYVKRNPVIKDVDFYNASAQVWDAFGAQRANNSFLIEDGKIKKAYGGSNTQNLTDMIKFLGIQTQPIRGLNDSARKSEISGCTPMWPDKTRMAFTLSQ